MRYNGVRCCSIVAQLYDYGIILVYTQVRDAVAHRVRINVTNTNVPGVGWSGYAAQTVLCFAVPPNAGEGGTPLKALIGFDQVRVTLLNPAHLNACCETEGAP